MAAENQQALLELLLRAERPMSGDELAAKLRVSGRTVRTYVKSINKAGEIVSAMHRGYEVDRRAYGRMVSNRRRDSVDTPDKRLLVICRDLAKRSSPINVYDLADQLSVSDSTLEADLTRVRDLIRQYDLQLRRDHGSIWLDGAERDRRRLVRQIIYSSTKGLIPSTWQALIAEYAQYDLRALRERVGQTIALCDLEFNEFALNDLLVHLVVTIDRVNEGNVVSETEGRSHRPDPAVESLTTALADVVRELYGVTLPGPELEVLYGVVALRAIRGAREGTAEAIIETDVRMLVAEIMEDISERYLLGPANRAMQLNLALHVQNMAARAHSGAELVAPLGDEFKNSHPLIHDLALYFAGRVEARLGISVAPGELDYLTFHMGMQYLRYLEQRDLVTLTLVVPKYYDMAARLEIQLSDVIRGQAVIEEVITTMDFDFSSAVGDLIVSTVPIGEGPMPPVVVVSPFLTIADIDQVQAKVRLERQRNAHRRVRTMLRSLIDARAYHHVDSVDSKETALAILCDSLTSAGYVEPGFYDDVLDRECRSATAFGGEFAIPHSMYLDANRTGIAVMISDKGIPWGGSSVRIVFLFALSPDGRATFRDALDELTRVLSESSNVTALLAADRDFDSFMAALMSLLTTA
ncbi:PTS sugar transporter subunit IIA [Cryobacterium sp. 10S3]|uniref:BglG family transcription antiterminator n=1 Tax=Cryobacterium sp. 10S3 TaxID=3048582 RepID=UPI002AC9AF24|nr:PTS sugar transporter subunit IIA [Cryobacterium sp. 10S3]MEB0287492.1 PTS sugar transporter subunit IIA [Cryobacterium sp. 10S3]WPX13284.1 PTS sugar transporter subunit IIA [Cryobacterium sp. 10S3]